jgi:hypothetical protein
MRSEGADFAPPARCQPGPATAGEGSAFAFPVRSRLPTTQTQPRVGRVFLDKKRSDHGCTVDPVSAFTASPDKPAILPPKPALRPCTSGKAGRACDEFQFVTEAGASEASALYNRQWRGLGIWIDELFQC